MPHGNDTVHAASGPVVREVGCIFVRDKLYRAKGTWGNVSTFRRPKASAPYASGHAMKRINRVSKEDASDFPARTFDQ